MDMKSSFEPVQLQRDIREIHYNHGLMATDAN